LLVVYYATDLKSELFSGNQNKVISSRVVYNSCICNDGYGDWKVLIE
jgi:hypothetical protein